MKAGDRVRHKVTGAELTIARVEPAKGGSPERIFSEESPLFRGKNFSGPWDPENLEPLPTVLQQAMQAADKDPEFITKFSGVKTNYHSGATRDNNEGRGRFDLISPWGTERLAKVYERGARNHGDRNWEQGIPFSRLIESAERHINELKKAYLEGRLPDEDHAAQAAWNLFAIMHFEHTMPLGLNDLWPNQKEQEVEQHPGSLSA